MERDEFAGRRCVTLPTLVQKDEDPSFFPCLSCRSRCIPARPGLSGVLRRRLNSSGTMSLRRILGYRWHDYMSNDLVLVEIGLRQVTCMVRDRQLPNALWACGATLCEGSRPSDTSLSISEWLDHAEGASTGFMLASCGV